MAHSEGEKRNGKFPADDCGFSRRRELCVLYRPRHRRGGYGQNWANDVCLAAPFACQNPHLMAYIAAGFTGLWIDEIRFGAALVGGRQREKRAQASASSVKRWARRSSKLPTARCRNSEANSSSGIG